MMRIFQNQSGCKPRLLIAPICRSAPPPPSPDSKTPESLAAIAAAIKACRHATATQQEAEEEAGQDRIARDKLIRKINSRRLAIQHAADALWPYTDEDNAPPRRAFKLPPDRPFNG